MPDITNPQLTDHCNQSLRPLGDRLTKLIIMTEAAIVEYNARNLGSVIDIAGSSNLIADGSGGEDGDGRTRVSGGDVYNLQTLLQNMKAFFDVEGRKDVIAKWNVNGHR